MIKNKVHISKYKIILLLSFVFVIIVFQYADFSNLGYIKDVEMIKNFVTRLIMGIFLMYVMIALGYRQLFNFKRIRQSLLIMIPAFIVSINNFPIIAYFDDRALLIEPQYRVFLFFIECLSIGFFEEILFRGILMYGLYQRLANTKNGVFLSILISSLIFGLIHIVNVFSGASIYGTSLQILYSFLMGLLWGVMYLKTGNLWLTMLLHASYNFFGQVMFYLGVVEGRYDIYTILITTVIALFTAIYALNIFMKRTTMITIQ